MLKIINYITKYKATILIILLTVIVVVLMIQNKQLETKIEKFLPKQIIGEKVIKINIRHFKSNEKVTISFPSRSKVLIFFLSETCNTCLMSKNNIDFFSTKDFEKYKVYKIYKKNTNEINNNIIQREYVIDWNENEEAVFMRPNYVPTTILVNNLGIIIFYHTGLVDEKVKNRLSELLKEG